MYETIKRLYKKTGNQNVVGAAVAKGWITPEQAAEIIGEVS